MAEMFDSPENAERCAGTPRDGMFSYADFSKASRQQECDGLANGEQHVNTQYLSFERFGPVLSSILTYH